MDQNQKPQDQINPQSNQKPIEIPGSKDAVVSESMVIGNPKEEASQSGWRSMFWAGAIIVIILGLAANRWQTKSGNDQSAQVSGGFWSNLFGGDKKDQPAPEVSTTKEDFSFVKNTDYVSAFDKTTLYAVRDGQYANGGTEVSPDSGMVATGDLNGDGKDEVATILNEKTDKHDFSLLAILEKDGDTYKNVKTLLLGDFVKIISLKIENGAARVSLATHRPEDLLTEPTSLETIVVSYDQEKGWLMNNR